jgi:hypothetical protein
MIGCMTTREHEPTLQDVMEMLIGMDRRMTTGFEAMNQRMDTMDARLFTVEQAVSKHSLLFMDILDELALMRADDAHDSKVLRDHERRISRLEGK